MATYYISCKLQRTLYVYFTIQFPIIRVTITVTLWKHVTKYKNMKKWMIEYLKKIENLLIKIARVNSILIAKSINLLLFTLILYGVGVRCDADIFKPTATANREVYGIPKLLHQMIL